MIRKPPLWHQKGELLASDNARATCLIVLRGIAGGRESADHAYGMKGGGLALRSGRLQAERRRRPCVVVSRSSQALPQGDHAFQTVVQALLLIMGSKHPFDARPSSQRLGRPLLSSCGGRLCYSVKKKPPAMRGHVMFVLHAGEWKAMHRPEQHVVCINQSIHATQNSKHG